MSEQKSDRRVERTKDAIAASNVQKMRFARYLKIWYASSRMKKSR